ncbi:50S ribosomal protein L21 [Candidatus Pacearchaeota archaeon CG1_02_31_27]|nr:MAG: 50S ribosomal protein L21 [Candidatus Pacearchaeota archaeon CG1_02_31_27]
MNIAVIKTGGKQYLVSPGQKLKIEKIEKAIGEEIVFNEVFLFSDGKKIEIGNPIVKTITVKAKVLSQDRAKKVTSIKFKPKTRYKKKIGHRQPYTEIKIESIS